MPPPLPQETMPVLPLDARAPLALPPLRAVGAVFAGGMIGAVLRVGFAMAFPVLPGAFPWTTFLENIVGAFLLGMVLVVLLRRRSPGLDLRPFLATGILGSFTTFSNYTVEILLLVMDGRSSVAAAYAFGSIAAGLGAAWLGMMTARVFVPARLSGEGEW